MGALDEVGRWDVPHAAAAIVAADGSIVESFGDTDRPFRLASLTKVVSGWTAMVAAEEGIVDLDQPAGQPGCTLRHLLAHAGGYGFNGTAPITAPGRRRIYSNTGIEIAAEVIGAAAAMPFSAYATAAVLEPLGMSSTAWAGSAAHGLVASVGDVVALLGEFLRPRLLSAGGAADAVSIQYPSLSGIVPGVGRFDPCPWGVAIEIRGEKSPHWTGATNSPATYGHFGGAGTMMWVDPDARCAVVALTDRPFDDWPDAVAEWSRLSDTVLARATE